MIDEKELKEKIDQIAESESFWNKYALQLVILVFIAGGGWVTLSQVQALAEDNKEKIEEDKRTIQEIDRTVIRMETTQKSLVKDVDDIQKKLDEILKAVQAAHREE